MHVTRMYWFLLILTLCSTGGLQVWRTLFDNFAVHVALLDGQHIGIIQSVREIPGFLAFLVVYIVAIIKEIRIAVFSVIILGVGIACTGIFPSLYGLIFTTLLMSFGFHYFETTNQSLTLQYYGINESPIVFGRLRSRASACSVVVGLFFLFFGSSLPYTELYLGAGSIIIITSLLLLPLNPTRPGMVPQRKKLVLRKRYWLFYLLTFMAGARRQVFIAFAVFLLVKHFDYSIQEVAGLFLLNNGINFFLSPFIGRCIVRYGERAVLNVEYGSLILIFIGYAVVDSRLFVAVLYILDHIFFNFSIAIRTFFQKIADPADIAPSMAVAFTINHIGAVILPVLGGLLWLIDYRIPFFFGALLCVFSLAAVHHIPGQLQHATTHKTSR